MNKKSESGQAIVLLVLAVVGLIGFTALAIDGGSVFADRRHAQSASDAASLAGGGNIALWLNNNFITYDNFSCGSQTVDDIINYGIYKAQERAEDNDYVDEEITVTAVCEDNGPVFLDDKYIDLTTHIETETETSFLQVVYGGPVANQVEAVVRVRPKAPLAFGNAIVALNEEPCGGKNGVVLGGASGTIIEGGGIWSNGCLKCEGLGSGSEDEPPVQVFGGVIGYVGSVDNCSSSDLDPNPEQQPEALPESSFSVPIPNCDHPDAITVDSIDKNTTLQSGKLYCVESAGNAVKVSSGYLYGEGVTLFMVNGGDVEINGDEVILTAPTTEDDPSPAVEGLLIYVNPVRDSVITINGNVESSYLGTIFAPRADVTINGTADVEDPEAMVVFYTQIIGYDVQISGNALIDINFNKDENYPKPAYLDLLD